MYIVKMVWSRKNENEFEYLSGYYTSKNHALQSVELYKSGFFAKDEGVSVNAEFIELGHGKKYAVIVNYNGGRLDDFLGVFELPSLLTFLEENGYQANKKTDVYIIPITVNEKFEGYTNTF